MILKETFFRANRDCLGDTSYLRAISYTRRVSGSTFGLPSSLLSLHMRLPILSARQAVIFFVPDSCRCFLRDGLRSRYLLRFYRMPFTGLSVHFSLPQSQPLFIT